MGIWRQAGVDDSVLLENLLGKTVSSSLLDGLLLLVTLLLVLLIPFKIL